MMNLGDSASTGLGIALLVALLVGSIPFGILIGRIFGVKNLRSQGSGNIGATNVARVAGFWPAGFLTFLLDTIKSAGPLFWITRTEDWMAIGPWVPWAAGLCAVMGHCFSPWLKFQGGKGVATALGVLLVLSPISAGAGFLVFMIAFLLTRTGSIASISGLIGASATYAMIHSIEPWDILGAALVLIVLIRHEKNIDALLENRENRFA